MIPSTPYEFSDVEEIPKTEKTSSKKDRKQPLKELIKLKRVKIEKIEKSKILDRRVKRISVDSAIEQKTLGRLKFENRVYRYSENRLNLSKMTDFDTNDLPIITPKNTPLTEEALLEKINQLKQSLDLASQYLNEEIKERLLLHAKRYTKKLPIEQTNLWLGKLMFIFSQLESPLSLEDEHTLRHPMLIDPLFYEKLNKFKQKVAKRCDLHRLTAIEDPEVVLKTVIPRVLAKILVTNSGHLNTALIPILTEEFLKEFSLSQYLTLHIKKALTAFSKDPMLTKKFEAIEPPIQQNTKTAFALRALLRLNSETELTAAHTKQAFLGALLTHLRQGNDGSCFATPLAVILLDNHIGCCIDDFQDLVNKGALSRTVDNVKQDFPFLLKMSEKTFNKELVLNQKGRIFEKESSLGYLYQAPSILAACQAIGITSPKESIESILTEKEFLKKTQKISVIEILRNLSKKRAEELNVSSCAHIFLMQACFAFSSETANPLIQIWENCIASMAEANETGMVQSAIIKAIKKTAESFLQKFLAEHPSSEEKITKSLTSHLVERIHLQYDPEIGSDNDHSHTGGAFVLYDKRESYDMDEWRRIDTPELFQNFLIEIFQNILESGKFNSEGFEALSAVLKEIEADTFTTVCLNNYYKKNKKLSNPLKEHSHLKYTPWITKCGNDFSKVVQVYFEEFQTSNTIQYKLTNGNDLLQALQNIGKLLQEEQGERSFLPVRIPNLHAFNLMIDTAPFLPSILNEDFERSWTKKLSSTKQSILNEPANERFKQKFFKKICKEFFPEKQRFKQEALAEKFSEEASVMDMRNLIVAELLKTFPGKQKEISLKVDELLLPSLPKKLRKKIEKNTLHFADTNWSKGMLDIHLCLIVNPGSGKLEIWGGYEDQSYYFPLNQENWIKEQIWEFYTEIE